MGRIDWLRAIADGQPLDTDAGPRSSALDPHGLPMLEPSDRYRDVGVIGRGGMATVRLVRDRAIRREVAVKLLAPELSRQPSVVQSFVEEALVTGQLSHPNIVPLHEVGRDGRGTVYFTMQRVAGRTLYDVLQDEDIPPGSPARLALALEAFLKVCDAVGYAHSRGVVHRDIKTANVMLGQFGEVYLMDWGLAKVLPRPLGGVDVPRGPASPLGRQPETAAGTPQYMAPEQAAEASCADERSDIFGLGAMLYEIVSGRPPFDAPTAEAALQLARACAPPPVDADGSFHVPRKLARVIDRAMSKRPEDRYATAEELGAQVREFLRRGHHLQQLSFGPGDTIVAQGDLAEAAFIVTRGECEAFRVVRGEKQALRRMGPGSMFGEAALLEATPRSATVQALTQVTVVVITRDDLDERLGTDTWEGLLVRTLVQRFRELDAELARVRDGAPAP